MAKFELRFICLSEVSYCTANAIREDEHSNLEFIEIAIVNKDEKSSLSVWLDKSTAIKFAKTIRTEINKITESEVNNG
jgi:hypothetical protein